MSLLKFAWGSGTKKPNDEDGAVAAQALKTTDGEPRQPVLRFGAQPSRAGVSTLLPSATPIVAAQAIPSTDSLDLIETDDGSTLSLTPSAEGVQAERARATTTEALVVYPAHTHATQQPSPTSIDPAVESVVAVSRASPKTEFAAPPSVKTGAQELRSLGDLESFKGSVSGVVTKGLINKCAVVDHGYSKTTIVCLLEFVATPQFQTVKQQLEERTLHYTVRHTSKEVLAELQEKIAHIAHQHRMLARDGSDRNTELYNNLIADAYVLGATDIHYTLLSDGRSKDMGELSLVHLRVAGRIHPWKQFPTSVLFDALAAGYGGMSVSGTNSGGQYQTGTPESTITKHNVLTADGKERTVSGRFTSSPTVGGGAKITVRLLDTDVRDVKIPTFGELGYADSQVHYLNKALRKNSGLFIMFGSTGSGKSTTLRTAMDSLPNKEALARYSVEDPVEYYMPGVVQYSVQRASDEDEDKVRIKFLSRLRDMMRQDPDVGMVGEIRDEGTALLASEMALTGHRLFTCMHGDDVIKGLMRASGKTINIPSETLASEGFLSAVTYQKLLPKLCPNCRIPASKGMLTKEQERAVTGKFHLDLATLFVANVEGCEMCNMEDIQSRGVRGLTVAAEVLTAPIIDRAFLNHVRALDWNGARDHWRGQRRTPYGDPEMTGKTSFEHAIYLMSIGVIDINDIEQEYEPLETYELFAVKEAAYGRGV